jgi:hypothetical protein
MMGTRVGDPMVTGITPPARDDPRDPMIRADDFAEVECSAIFCRNQFGCQRVPQERVITRRAHVETVLPVIEAERRNPLREVLGWNSPDVKREIGRVGWEGVCKEGQIAKSRSIALQGFQERRSPF